MDKGDTALRGVVQRRQQCPARDTTERFCALEVGDRHSPTRIVPYPHEFVAKQLVEFKGTAKEGRQRDN